MTAKRNPYNTGGMMVIRITETNGYGSFLDEDTIVVRGIEGLKRWLIESDATPEYTSRVLKEWRKYGFVRETPQCFNPCKDPRHKHMADHVFDTYELVSE